jgi:uncharacterized metal-binding protein
LTKLLTIQNRQLNFCVETAQNLKKFGNLENKPFVVSSVVVEIGGLVDDKVVVEVVSSMQRLSPEMQSTQDSSIVGQFQNMMQAETD